MPEERDLVLIIFEVPDKIVLPECRIHCIENAPVIQYLFDIKWHWINLNITWYFLGFFNSINDIGESGP